MMAASFNRMPTMKLHTSSGACSLADHIALHWIGQPFEVRVVAREERKSDAFLKLNPAGAVPVLEDGGWVLTQNAAILNYLVDRFPESGLGGDGSARGRADVNRWLSFFNADVHPTFHPLFGSTSYLDEAAVQQTKEAARKKLRGYFERVNAQLDGRDYISGARSIADPYLFVVTRWAKAMAVDLAGLPHLDAFFARMLADDGVRAAMQTEGLSA